MRTPAIQGGQPVRQDYLVFGSPRIEEAEIEEVVATIRSGWIGTGPKVQLFEEKFGKYVGGRNACAVSSCTAALHLALLASGVGPGDEVITTTMTFAATANAVTHTGARPVFADVDPDSLNIDPEDILRKITPKTRGIIPVHFAGRPCQMDKILEIAKAHNLFIVEDCAHAIESKYKGRSTGTIGDLGCYSFYVTKNVITGEGGMIVTDNDEYTERIKIMALHGMTKDAWNRFSDEGYKHYQVVEAGFKYNMTDIQASLGIHQLERVDTNHKRRQEIWAHYNQAFKQLACQIPATVDEHIRHSYHLYTLLLDLEALSIDRDRFLDVLDKENVGTGVHYLPVHSHPFYQKQFGCRPGEHPVAESIGRRTVSLPLSAKLSDRDVEDVIQAVSGTLNYFKR
jgi:dTDP-4-amino-4,6-dideoxygalactose transaminase